MTCPRSTQISLSDTPWYHVVSRCVRRAFLCGEDHVTGKNFDHRRDWLTCWILQLADIFAIDVAAYAVMSNHYHLVVRIDAERAAGWSVEEVLQRWTRLFSGPELVQRYLSSARDMMTDAECQRVFEIAEEYRARLTSLSWLMRILNENIAREANREDGVKGHFWEGRFKSQALLDETALLAAMAYVDLNPIRAGMAFTPEQSDHTSIQARIAALVTEEAAAEVVEPAISFPESPRENKTTAEVMEVLDTDLPILQASLNEVPEIAIATITEAEPSLKESPQLTSLPKAALMPFDATACFEQAIPFSFEDYLELVDTVGRTIHPEKRGAIPQTIPKILERLDIDTEVFIAHAGRLLKEFGHAVGRPEQLVALANRRQIKYLRGIATARTMCGRKAA